MSAPTQRRAARIAVVLAGMVCAALLAATASLLLRGGLSQSTLSGPDVALALTCPVVALALLLRQPGNRVGQLLLVTGVGASTLVFSQEYAHYALDVRPGSLPGGVWALWLSEWVWVLGFSSVLLFLTLVFPTGRLASRRWLPVACFNGVVTVCLLVVGAFHAGALSEDPSGPLNPVGVRAVPGSAAAVSSLFVAALLSTLVCIIGLVLRMRRARGAERAQLKWFAYSAAVAVVALLGGGLSFILTARAISALSIVGSVALGGLPVAIGIAVLRYRLYEIDRLISRTVSYALVTGALLLVYLGTVTLVSRLTPGGSALAVAASTLAVAALFQPLRRRVQRAVDHRFNRAGYDAELTIAAFSRKLREQVDLEVVRTDLLAVACQTMQPASVGLWLRTSR